MKIPCDNCNSRGWLRIPIAFRAPNGPSHGWCPKCNDSRESYDLRMIRERSALRRLEKAIRGVVESTDYFSGHLAHHDDCNIHYDKGDGTSPCDCDVRFVTKALAALDGNVLDDIVSALNEEDDDA